MIVRYGLCVLVSVGEYSMLFATMFIWLGPDSMVLLTVQEIEKVVEEVQELPVQVAGLQELEQGVADARAWLVRVRTTLGLIHLYEYRTSVTLLTDLLASIATAVRRM